MRRGGIKMDNGKVMMDTASEDGKKSGGDGGKERVLFYLCSSCTGDGICGAGGIPLIWISSFYAGELDW